MAYWIRSAGSDTRSGHRTFYMDSDSDLINLPTSKKEGVKQDVDSTANHKCAIGSEALSIGSGKVYVLNSSDEWKEIK